MRKHSQAALLSQTAETTRKMARANLREKLSEYASSILSKVM
jgi:hypothetical protein